MSLAPIREPDTVTAVSGSFRQVTTHPGRQNWLTHKKVGYRNGFFCSSLPRFIGPSIVYARFLQFGPPPEPNPVPAAGKWVGPGHTGHGGSHHSRCTGRARQIQHSMGQENGHRVMTKLTHGTNLLTGQSAGPSRPCRTYYGTSLRLLQGIFVLTILRTLPYERGPLAPWSVSSSSACIIQVSHAFA